VKHFLSLSDLTGQEITALLDRADRLQELWKSNLMPKSLAGHRVALWFWGQGFRNRMAFETGARALGADVAYVPGELGVQEPLEDVTRYLNNWFTMLVIRCREHADLEQVTRDASMPVINARTGYNHPCEILGDLQYIRLRRGSLEGLNVVFTGEVTNLCRSWFEAARVLPISVTQIGPTEYLLPADQLAALNRTAAGTIAVTTEISGNINRKTEVLYTDCWPHDEDRSAIEKAFLPYRITRGLVDSIHPGGFFLPCPPVTRGEEVTAEAMGHELCQDYAAKEYLLHAQNAVMEMLAGRD
jgi:ornithine carbamoyltransferase